MHIKHSEMCCETRKRYPRKFDYGKFSEKNQFCVRLKKIRKDFERISEKQPQEKLNFINSITK